MQKHTITESVEFNTSLTFEFGPGEKPNTQTAIPKFVTVDKHSTFEFSRSVYREIAENTLESEFPSQGYELARSPLGDMPEFTFEVHKKFSFREGK